MKVLERMQEPDTIDEVQEKVKSIETLACQLRCELEELQQLVWDNEIEMYDNDLNEVNSYTIEDWASDVSTIEQAFDTED